MFASPDRTFVERAQSLLDRKATRSYAMPTYLVLDARVAALNSTDEGPALVGQLTVPRDAPFKGVYLLLNRNAAIGPAGVDFFEVTRRGLAL